MKKIAVILSGCGVFDGSEIHETVLTLNAIVKAGAAYECFAPDIEVGNPVNHYTKQPGNVSFNVLEMSARIARGNIKDVKEYRPEDFDALFFPGGMGAVRNLCSFDEQGIDCHINKIVRDAIAFTYKAKKPIGALCIAPVLVARVLGTGKLTIGNDAKIASAIAEMGSEHVNTPVDEACVDEENKLVSSPAYMLAADISEVEKSANAAIEAMLRLM